MVSKPRILFVNESSFLNTGFAVIGHEVMSRLFKTEKYEIAELGCYGQHNDQRALDLPWRHYYAWPHPQDKAGQQKFGKNPADQFGAAEFEKVCLDFQPNVVVDWRDTWMWYWQTESPYRRFFKHVLMPTCDSLPVLLQDLAWYSTADTLMTQAEFGKEAIEQASNNKIRVHKACNPGANTEIFKPVKDKEALRKSFGIPANAFIFGTVMRNQPRKLYPQLLNVFNKYFDKCVKSGKADLAQKSFLYIHSSYPDVGFDFARHVLESGLSHKVLFTRKCSDCGKFYASFFAGERSGCYVCNGPKSHMPNTSVGLSRQELAIVYNFFDAYVQYSTCLAPNQPVVCKDGVKTIKEVEVGDYVVSSSGVYNKVLEKFKKHSSKIVEIDLFSNFNTISCTKDHEVWAYTKQNVCPESKLNIREWLGTRDADAKQIEPSLVAVSDLKKQDLLAEPRLAEFKEPSSFDMLPFAKELSNLENHDEKWLYLNCASKKQLSRWIHVDHQFSKFCGLFAADGTADNKSVRVCSSSNSFENHKLVENVFSQWVGETKKAAFTRTDSETKHCVTHAFNSKAYAIWFKSQFYTKDGDKKVPSWIFNAPLGIQKQFLTGWIAGDGYVSNRRNTARLIATTVSKALAYQIRQMLVNIGAMFSCNKLQKSKYRDGYDRKEFYSFEITPESFSGDKRPRQSSNNFYYNKYRLTKIKEIQEKEPDENCVYDIEVENEHNYVVPGCLVKNCEGFGVPLSEAKATALPVVGPDYSATEDHVHSPGGTPIDINSWLYESVNETGQMRSLPDDNDAAKKLYKIATMSEETRASIGQQARQFVIDHQSFEGTARDFEEVFDNLDLSKQPDWKTAQPLLCPLNAEGINKQLANPDFVHDAIAKILGRAISVSMYQREVYIKGLAMGYVIERKQRVPMDRNKLVERLVNMAQNHNAWEHARMDKFAEKGDAIGFQTI